MKPSHSDETESNFGPPDGKEMVVPATLWNITLIIQSRLSSVVRYFPQESTGVSNRDSGTVPADLSGVS